MGGHALKKVIASRINLIEYNKVKLDLAEKFQNLLDIKFVIDVPNKQDFGDIDVLYSLESSDLIDIISLIKKLFNPIEIVPNGPILSFSYSVINTNDNSIASEKYFQVDLIYCKNIEMGKFYFSYGDLGGIIGIYRHTSRDTLGLEIIIS